MTPQQALRILEKYIGDAVDQTGESQEAEAFRVLWDLCPERKRVTVKSIFKSAAIPVIIGVSLAIGTAACSQAQHSAHPVPSAERSQAKAGLKQVTARCIPASAGAQVQLAHSVLSKAGRQALAIKCGIPPQHKAAFEAQVLDSAEHGHLTTKAGRTEFFTVTLPQVIVRNQT